MNFTLAILLFAVGAPRDVHDCIRAGGPPRGGEQCIDGRGRENLVVDTEGADFRDVCLIANGAFLDRPVAVSRIGTSYKFLFVKQPSDATAARLKGPVIFAQSVATLEVGRDRVSWALMRSTTKGHPLSVKIESGSGSSSEISSLKTVTAGAQDVLVSFVGSFPASIALDFVMRSTEATRQRVFFDCYGDAVRRIQLGELGSGIEVTRVDGARGPP